MEKTGSQYSVFEKCKIITFFQKMQIVGKTHVQDNVLLKPINERRSKFKTEEGLSEKPRPKATIRCLQTIGFNNCEADLTSRICENTHGLVPVLMADWSI